MKPVACSGPAGRRTFLKNLGGLLLAGAMGDRLLMAEPPHPAQPAQATAADLPPLQAPTEIIPEEWNGLSDPGWSG